MFGDQTFPLKGRLGLARLGFQRYQEQTGLSGFRGVQSKGTPHRGFLSAMFGSSSFHFSLRIQRSSNSFPSHPPGLSSSHGPCCQGQNGLSCSETAGAKIPNGVVGRKQSNGPAQRHRVPALGCLGPLLRCARAAGRLRPLHNTGVTRTRPRRIFG